MLPNILFLKRKHQSDYLSTWKTLTKITEQFPSAWLLSFQYHHGQVSGCRIKRDVRKMWNAALGGIGHVCSPVFREREQGHGLARGLPAPSGRQGRASSLLVCHRPAEDQGQSAGSGEDHQLPWRGLLQTQAAPRWTDHFLEVTPAIISGPVTILMVLLRKLDPVGTFAPSASSTGQHFPFLQVLNSLKWQLFKTQLEKVQSTFIQ